MLGPLQALRGSREDKVDNVLKELLIMQARQQHAARRTPHAARRTPHPRTQDAA